MIIWNSHFIKTLYFEASTALASHYKDQKNFNKRAHPTAEIFLSDYGSELKGNSNWI